MQATQTPHLSNTAGGLGKTRINMSAKAPTGQQKNIKQKTLSLYTSHQKRTYRIGLSGSTHLKSVAGTAPK
jgi:hypothetical protein